MHVCERRRARQHQRDRVRARSARNIVQCSVLKLIVLRIEEMLVRYGQCQTIWKDRIARGSRHKRCSTNPHQFLDAVEKLRAIIGKLVSERHAGRPSLGNAQLSLSSDMIAPIGTKFYRGWGGSGRRRLGDAGRRACVGRVEHTGDRVVAGAILALDMSQATMMEIYSEIRRMAGEMGWSLAQ